jgi:serine palmitoyltransferase
MGTFTKSFSGMGGYIAGSKDLINFIKANSAGILYHNSMSPIICQQVITAFKVIMGRDGTDIGQKKLDALRDNSNFFRQELKRLGLEVIGNEDSPIIPVMLYVPSKIAAFSRECLKRGLAVVVVGFPAVSVLTGRSRFCISAGHKKEDLAKAIEVLDEVADVVRIKYMQ